VPLAIKGTLVPGLPSSHKLGSSTRVVDDAGIAGGRHRPAAGASQLPTLFLASQNVRGFSKKKRRTEAWFDGLRGQIEGQALDAVFLQETKATKNWAATLEDRYARGWGIRNEQISAPLSYWTAQSERPEGSQSSFIRSHRCVSSNLYGKICGAHIAWPSPGRYKVKKSRSCASTHQWTGRPEKRFTAP
jgi:hypothetical protein